MRSRTNPTWANRRAPPRMNAPYPPAGTSADSDDEAMAAPISSRPRAACRAANRPRRTTGQRHRGGPPDRLSAIVRIRRERDVGIVRVVTPSGRSGTTALEKRLVRNRRLAPHFSSRLFRPPQPPRAAYAVNAATRGTVIVF